MPKNKMSLEDWIQGVLATAMAAIAVGIFMKITWQGWDAFIDWVMKTFGVGAEVEYILGGIIFVAAVILGLVKLKKFGKKLKLPFLVLPRFLCHFTFKQFSEFFSFHIFGVTFKENST